MHHWVNCGEAKALKLLELSQQSQLVLSHVLDRPLHRRTTCQALRRPTPAQRGSLYYENYMRKRREKGGVFLGPPVQPPAWKIQPEEQQRSVQQQQKSMPGQQPLAQSGDAPLAHQQQQQQQQSPSKECDNRSSSSRAPAASLRAQQLQQAAPASLDPIRFRALLEESMLATAPQPLQPSQLNPSVHPQHLLDPAGLQQQQGLRAQPLQSPTPQQYQQQPRQAWQFKDYLAPELAESLLPTLKRKGGTIIEQPVVQQGHPLIPLPDLHSSTAFQNESHNPNPMDSSSSSGGRASSSSNSSSAGGSSSSGRTRVLHVYWDISSAHPGGLDPRVIVAHLRHVLSSYGQIAGIYAYGLQKMFNWVPEAFMLEYAPERLPGGKQKRLALSQKQQQQQQEELEKQLQAVAASGVDLDEVFGPLRCPCCGKLRSNYQQLHLHMVQRHKQPAPPLMKLLPATALSSAAAAAAGSSGQQSRQTRQSLTVSTWSPSDVKSIMNNSTRTLGRVARYYNSQGALFVPPESHQISLKYVLLREGVEVRLVQNHKHAVDVSLAEGLHVLLQQLLQRDAVSAQQYEDVVVVISDRETHTQMLTRFKRAGIAVIAVCRGIRRYSVADITLRWQWVVNGRYDC